MHVYEGNYTEGAGYRIGIIAARFNQTIVEKLIGGAEDALTRHGVIEENIDLFWAPGAYELPLVAKKCAITGSYDALICLGAVIRGETAHFDYVAGQAAAGIASVSLQTEIPVLFGVLTTETLEQAFCRAGTKMGNIGFNTAMSALEMVSLTDKIEDLCDSNNSQSLDLSPLQTKSS